MKKAKHVIDNNITLVEYYPNYDISLQWYQDIDICKQVDNIDKPYTLEMLEAMYNFLCANGECYYIQFKDKLIGDVSLYKQNELAIVIAKEYQNQHIGRKCISYMISLARQKGLKELKAHIYSFNHQSQKMFSSLGFVQIDEEHYIYKL